MRRKTVKAETVQETPQTRWQRIKAMPSIIIGAKGRNRRRGPVYQFPQRHKPTPKPPTARERQVMRDSTRRKRAKATSLAMRAANEGTP